MFITQLELRPKTAAYITAKNQLSAAHSWISDSLKIGNEHPQRYLWYLDAHKQQLVIVSRTIPDTLVLGRYGDLSTLTTKLYYLTLDQSLYQFQICVNPTKRSRHNRRIQQLTDPLAQKQWLQRKAANNGFVIEHWQRQSQQNQLLRHNQQQAATLVSVIFTGQLRITDKKRFINALTKGIGREKAYGFGLLLIQPVS